jgi:hypothetical protein
MELEPVQKVWLNHDNDLVDVTLVATTKDAQGKTTQQQEVLHTNEKHPFLTKEKGFIPVSQLKPGMHVLEADGQYGVVATLTMVPGGMWMYNLTVAQDHTYAVGLDQWVVHNCPNTDSGEQQQPNRNLAQKLVQGNNTINNGIIDPDAPGGDISKWQLNSMEKSPIPNTDLAPYTDRYYLTFNDGGGQVKISGNFNPNDGTWHGPTFHYSSDQPDPERWSPSGQVPSEEEQTLEDDIDFFMDLFGGE